MVDITSQIKSLARVILDLGGCRDTTEYSSIQQRLDVKRQVCGSAMRDVLSELGFVHLVENSIVAVQLSGGTQHCSGPIIWWDWKSSRE